MPTRSKYHNGKDYMIVNDQAPFVVLHKLLEKYSIPKSQSKSVSWLYSNLHTLPLLKKEQEEVMIQIKSLMFIK